MVNVTPLPLPEPFAPSEAEAASRRSVYRAKGLCPSCGRVALTKHERRNGYQCPDCTARDEGTSCF